MSALTQLYLTRLWWIPTLSAVTLTNPRVMQIKRVSDYFCCSEPPPRQTPARFNSATWLRATVSQDGITSGRTVITVGFECRSNNKLSRFEQFFVGQSQNPSSRSRAKSLVVVTAEVRGAPGPHSSQLLLSGALDHKGFCSADSAV